MLRFGEPLCGMGLPVHVNGTFVCSPKTGHLEADEDSTETASVWNRMIMKDIIAGCYAELLVGFAAKLQPQRALTHPFKTMLPSEQRDRRWNGLVYPTWERLFVLPIAIARSASPAWLTVHNVHERSQTPYEQAQRLRDKTIPPPDPSEPRSKSARKAVRTAGANRSSGGGGGGGEWCWAAPRDVYFLDNTGEENRVLADLLGQMGFPICLVEQSYPLSVMEEATRTILPAVGSSPVWLTPQLVREQLASAPAAALQMAYESQADGVRRILRYASSDECRSEQLLGLPLPMQVRRGRGRALHDV